MIDNAREEQDVRDLSNFLALLLRGAEVTHGAYYIVQSSLCLLYNTILRWFLLCLQWSCAV